MQSVLDACATGRVRGRVSVVISNNGNARALLRARAAGIPVYHLSAKTHSQAAVLDAAIRDALVAAQVELVFLGGYMKKLGPLTLTAFKGRVLNTHPALLPKFGGPGMYGDNVFEAVLKAGVTESGISIHLVDSEYDSGPVVRQCRIPVFPGDSLDDLRTRVRSRERDFVVETLAGIADGQIALAAAG